MTEIPSATPHCLFLRLSPLGPSSGRVLTSWATMLEMRTALLTRVFLLSAFASDPSGGRLPLSLSDILSLFSLPSPPLQNSTHARLGGWGQGGEEEWGVPRRTKENCPLCDEVPDWRLPK